MAPAIPIITLGLMAVSTGVSMYESMNKPSQPNTPSQTDTSSQDAKNTEAAAQAQATAIAKRRGMASTVLTSPLGVTGTPSTQKATLGA